MFEWLNDPVTRGDLWASVVLLAIIIYGSLEHHREKTANWLPNLLRTIRDER